MSTKPTDPLKRKRGRPRVADPRSPVYLPLGIAEYNRLRAAAGRDRMEARPWARARLMEVVAASERAEHDSTKS